MVNSEILLSSEVFSTDNIAYDEFARKKIDSARLTNHEDYSVDDLIGFLRESDYKPDIHTQTGGLYASN